MFLSLARVIGIFVCIGYNGSRLAEVAGFSAFSYQLATKVKCMQLSLNLQLTRQFWQTAVRCWRYDQSTFKTTYKFSSSLRFPEDIFRKKHVSRHRCQMPEMVSYIH